MEGVIQGGWEFVWAAYGITWAGWIGYAVSLVVRTKRTQHEDGA